jgi:hypothetical protein
MAAATIGHVKLLRPLRERDFALRGRVHSLDWFVSIGR